MATTEGEFKSEFKKDLQRAHPSALVWTNTDLIRSGLPDISILPGRPGYLAVEAKFVKKLPKKKTSKVLHHEVSVSQQQFLKSVQASGNRSIVLIGMSTVAVVMTDIRANYTLEEVMAAPRVEKLGGVWQLEGFLNEWA